MTQNENKVHGRLDETLSVCVLDSSNNEQKASFLYNNLIRYILLHLSQTEGSKQKLFEKLKFFSNEGTDYDKQISETFAQDYKAIDAVHWYTRQSFLYGKLNKALRESDVDFLYDTRHFLIDLHRQLQERHLNFDTKQTLYRGVSLDDSIVDDLLENKDKLVHFDQFLSTSIDEEIAKNFIGNPVGNKKGVLFHINIDFEIAKKLTRDQPIACIEELSERSTEKEVIFHPSIMYRLSKTEKVLEKVSNSSRMVNIHHIYLELTTDRDLNLQKTYDVMKKDIYIDDSKPTNIVQLAKLLKRLDKLASAIKFYQMALDDPTLGTDLLYKVTIYTDLAIIHRLKKDYDSAMTALAMAQKSATEAGIRDFEQPFRTLTNNKALIYQYKGDFKSAFYCMNKTLDLLKEAKIGPEDPGREYSIVLNNIGSLCENTSDSTSALLCYKQVLLSQEKVLPTYHTEKARTYNNISRCYNSLKDYQKAKEYAEEAENMKSKILPDDHQSMALTKAHLGRAQYNLE